MRVKTVDKTPRILLNMDEAYEIKEALEECITLCSLHGFDEVSGNAQAILEKLDEAILKAESL